MLFMKRQLYVPADTTGARAIVIVSWVFPCLATLAVVGRFISRKLRRKSFGFDDWLILCALVNHDC